MAEGKITVTESPGVLSVEETEATIVVSSVGLQGAAGVDDKHFIHNQTTPADEWVIQHDLDKKPSVTVVDSADNQWQAEVEYVDSNNLIVRTQAPFSGKAYLN